MKKSVSCLALLAGLALATAEQALARDYPIQGVTVLWSQLSPTPTQDDTVSINGGGTLFVDVATAQIGTVRIGNDSTPGSLVFDNNSRTLTVKNDVIFSSNAGNALNMSAGTVEHTIKVGGAFLSSGAGVFSVGLGTVEYNGAAQTVTARISGNTIQYKNLTLSGSNTKTFQDGVTVQGKLKIVTGITIAGTIGVTYGGLASLEYTGLGSVTTSNIEWPTTLNIPVALAGAGVYVRMNSAKTLGSSLRVDQFSFFDTEGRDLTVRGNIENNGGFLGTGRVILAGSAAQTLTGASSAENAGYGNLVVNNTHADGVTAPAGGLMVNGRLNLVQGRVTLTGDASRAALLTINGIDQVVGDSGETYGSSASAATRKNDAYFGGTGIMTLPQKPTSGFNVTARTSSYGAATVTLSGNVTGGTYGNVPVDGELITIAIETTPVALIRNTTTTGGNGSFSLNFESPSLPAGTYRVTYSYAGGINLRPASTQLNPGLTVTKLTVRVTPRNKSKVYGNADPPLDYDFTPPLVPGDVFTGSLRREGIDLAVPEGEQVGNYDIEQGTLALNQNYILEFTTGRVLTITPKPVSVVADAKTKTYGAADPPLTYTYTPFPLSPFGDVFEGSLTRVAGENVGDYAINRGTLVIRSSTGSTANFTINYTGANLRINRLNTTVTLATGSTGKVYGSDDPTLNPAFSPALVSGDSYTGTLARAAGNNVGSYPVNIGTVKIMRGTTDVTSNYNLNLASPLNFVISKKGLVISAVPIESSTIPYGDAIPNLINYAGLVYDQKAPATPATVGQWSPSQPTVGSLPGDYAYRVQQTAADPNYEITYGTVAGTLRITTRALTVRADNQSKLEDGQPFQGTYTASYNFAAGDTPASAFTGGSIAFSGPALTATAAGVYEIVVSGNLTSIKYGPINYATGSLVISKAIGTTEVEGIQTWGPGGNYSWAMNRANGGQAGADPGWKLLKVKKDASGSGGTLNISAAPDNRFSIYLSTLNPSTPTAGPAAKFDPTRPYSWKSVEAEGQINGFNAASFNLISQGSGLFANPIYGGTFSVSATPAETPKQLFVNFTPKPQAGEGALTDAEIDSLRAAMLASDVDVMYLEPDKYSITPQEPVTIRVNVGNLRQPVFGAQAYLRFSSQHFVSSTDPKVAGIPVIAPGGGVWDNVIFKIWETDGDLDVVIGLSFTVPLGTMDPATVALITLTPNKTATGKSRVIFRGDTQTITGGATGGSLLTSGDGSPIYPARIPTKDIAIATDETKPKINSIAATQTQYGTSRNVKNRTDADPEYRTVRGTLNVTVNATDLPGVGLKQAPTVRLTGPGGQTLDMKVTNPGTGDGDFFYTQTIDHTTENGRWNALVTATDNLNQSETGTFYVIVNVSEVTGVVELDSFRGSSRLVTFAAGKGSGDILKTWQLNVATTDSKFLASGEFRDLLAFSKRVMAPDASDTTSMYLRFGTVANLASLVNRLLYGTDGMAGYLRDLEFGYFEPFLSDTGPDFHTDVALKLKNPTRSIDAYIRGRLSPTTISLLNAYPVDPTKVTPEQVAALETALLNDYNAIVIGPPASIYDQLRFSSVQPPVREDGNRVDQILDKLEDGNPDTNPTTAEYWELNRLLLSGAYLPYMHGRLNPTTAQGMLAYAGGSDPNLTRLLLYDFDVLANPVAVDLWEPGDSIYTEERFLGIPLRPQTSNLVLKLMNDGSLPDGELMQLNRWLLEDAFASSLGVLNYSAGALSPPTVLGLSLFIGTPTADLQKAVEPLLVADMNKVLNSGAATRTGLESTYATEITKYASRASYTLIDVPADTTLVSAKTAWNLRQRLAPAADSDAYRKVAYFVNGEKVVADNHLRAGDINGDNNINLGDYTIMQQTFGSTTDLTADVNGDGRVNILDYSVQQAAFGLIGDPAVNQ